jgi:hypothetical protein
LASRPADHARGRVNTDGQREVLWRSSAASALIAATAARGKSPELILTATVATLLVFWLAHVFARLWTRALWPRMGP